MRRTQQFSKNQNNLPASFIRHRQVPVSSLLDTTLRVEMLQRAEIAKKNASLTPRRPMRQNAGNMLSLSSKDS